PGSQGEAPMGVEPDANQKAELADQNERQPVLQYRQPFITLRNGRLALVDTLVERFGAVDLFGGGFDPYRLVTDHLIAFENRCDIGVDPVVVTGFTAILDNAHPGQALLQSAPHVRKHRCRDVWVTYQVVRCTDQFLTRKTTYLNESVVAVGNHAFGIGGGNQPLLSREGTFRS